MISLSAGIIFPIIVDVLCYSNPLFINDDFVEDRTEWVERTEVTDLYPSIYLDGKLIGTYLYGECVWDYSLDTFAWRVEIDYNEFATDVHGSIDIQVVPMFSGGFE